MIKGERSKSGRAQSEAEKNEDTKKVNLEGWARSKRMVWGGGALGYRPYMGSTLSFRYHKMSKIFYHYNNKNNRKPTVGTVVL